MKKYIISLLLFTGFAVLYSEENIQRAPLNPDFINYQTKKLSGLSTVQVSDEGYILGEIPPPFLRSFTGYEIKVDKLAVTDSVYDLRTAGTGGTSLLTSVKDQGNCGSCWTFGTMGAIEAKWKKDGLGDYDLSEENLNSCHGFLLEPCEGGNVEMAMAYFARKSGPVLEEEAPYTAAAGNCPSGLIENAYISDMRQVPNDMATIKQALIDYGGLYTNFRWESASYRSSDYTFYYGGSTDSSTNHAVLLSGWDDTKETAGGTGAWIIKNSWGAEWGEDGYFYISYNDVKVNSVVAYFPNKIDYVSNAKILLYDELGCVGSVGYGSIFAAGLVKFTTDEPIKIKKIGTYANAVNSTIAIDIYDAFDGETLNDDDKIARISSKTCALPGYYSFDLPSEIYLAKGENVYIRVKYTTPQYTYPIPAEFASDGYANPVLETGVCWISSNGASWVDTDTSYDIAINAYGVVPNIVMDSPSDGDVWRAGTTQSIEWSGMDVNNVKIEYSIDNELTWQSIADSVVANLGAYTWTVQAAASDTCLIKITDLECDSVYVKSPVFTIFTYPETFKLSEKIGFGNADNVENYRIAGIPGDVNLSVSKFMEGKQPNDWNACWDNGADSSYQIEYDGTEVFNFQPGRAFWILSRNTLKLSQTVNSVGLSSNYTYSIPLHDGWNLISNPFERTIAWADVLTLNGLPSNRTIYFWDGGWSQPAEFDVYTGYYYYNLDNLDSLEIPYNTQPILAKKTTSMTISGKNIRISLKNGSRQYSTAIIAVNASASNDLDDLDYFCPPASFEKAGLSIYASGLTTKYKALSIEQRPEIGIGSQFDLRVRNLSGDDLQMTIEGVGDFDGLTVGVLDRQTNRLTFLRTDGSVTIPSAMETGNFQLIFGDENYFTELENALTPVRFNLSQNAPNPFNPSTTISFELPKTSDISLTVYDIMGREVINLIDKTCQAGYLNVVWDGKDKIGQQVSSGIYLYALRSSAGYCETKKMVLIR